MTNSRFPWSRVPLDAQVDQLQKHGFRRYIAKDSPLKCVVCKAKPKRGDRAIYPSEGCSSTNQVIAHETCIEAAYKAAQASRQSEAVSLGLKPLTVPTQANPAQLTQTVNVTPTADPLAQLAKIRQEIYNEGYNAGIKAALAQLQGLTDEHSPRVN